jgi:hypothetical protein
MCLLPFPVDRASSSRSHNPGGSTSIHLLKPPVRGDRKGKGKKTREAGTETQPESFLIVPGHMVITDLRVWSPTVQLLSPKERTGEGVKG